MIEATLVLTVGLMGAALVAGCDRGIRLPGISWFDISHEMRGTPKKASGRFQQRKRSR